MSSGSTMLLERIAQKGNLRRAWDRLNKLNPGSFGVDEVTIEEFALRLGPNLASIRDRLLAGTYQFSAVRAVAIDKSSGSGLRPLRIATVSDRVVQKAILLRLESLPTFRKFRQNRHSFAYIRGRNMGHLVERIRELMAEYPWVLESDISSFFDSINRDRLLAQVESRLPDPSINALLRDALNAEVYFAQHMPDHVRAYFPGAGDGVPQGAAISPLLSNIYLHDFDMTISRSYGYVRYADDFLVFAPSRDAALAAFSACRDHLAKLNLSIPDLRAPRKPSRVQPSSGGFEFVGFRFEKNHVSPTPEALARINNMLREVFDPRTPASLSERFVEAERRLSSWAGAYKRAVDISKQLDEISREAADHVHRLLASRGLSKRTSLGKNQAKFLRVIPRAFRADTKTRRKKKQPA